MQNTQNVNNQFVDFVNSLRQNKHQDFKTVANSVIKKEQPKVISLKDKNKPMLSKTTEFKHVTQIRVMPNACGVQSTSASYIMGCSQPKVDGVGMNGYGKMDKIKMAKMFVVMLDIYDELHVTLGNEVNILNFKNGLLYGRQDMIDFIQKFLVKN